jgi:16S rRNA (cytosine967-C5)-methyltransferase
VTTNQIGAREIVLDMLLEVIEGDKYSHTVLNQTLRANQNLDKQERAFISRLFQGTVKSYLKLDYIIGQFSNVPIKKMKPLIRNLLRLSVYQLLSMDQVPASAVCNEAVKIAKKRGFTGLSGFVNGVLRNTSRKLDLVKYPDKHKDSSFFLEVMYSVPDWLAKELLKQYDFSTVEAMLQASLKEKELTIRCNKSKITPEQLKQELAAEGITVEQSEYLDYAFKLKDYDYLEKLETFQKGKFAVQDVSSMLVCQVAGLKDSDFVIDVCAAPGGKALHAAESAKKVSARDLTLYKTKLIDDNIKRMGFGNIDTKVWDATILDESITGQADVVICDLPCSGLGVFGKKSDLKYKLAQNQFKELVELQRAILKIAQSYVKENGVLIFSTCTVNREENQDNRDFIINNLKLQPESLDEYLPDKLCTESTKEGFLQLIPGIHETDGFFISKFRKTGNYMEV